MAAGSTQTHCAQRSSHDGGAEGRAMIAVKRVHPISLEEVAGVEEAGVCDTTMF